MENVYEKLNSKQCKQLSKFNAKFHRVTEMRRGFVGGVFNCAKKVCCSILLNEIFKYKQYIKSLHPLVYGRA